MIRNRNPQGEKLIENYIINGIEILKENSPEFNELATMCSCVARDRGRDADAIEEDRRKQVKGDRYSITKKGKAERCDE